MGNRTGRHHNPVGVVPGIGWLIKASFLADLLSNPILTGYMTGVAILMIVSQLPKILGFDLNTDTIGELISSEWQTPNAHTILIATIVVVLSLISRRISNRSPVRCSGWPSRLSSDCSSPTSSGWARSASSFRGRVPGLRRRGRRRTDAARSEHRGCLVHRCDGDLARICR